jgi:predicted AAA+ superfamily ATPase
MAYIKRTIEAKIEHLMENRRALFILGARQVGKTTLLKRTIEKVGNDRAVYFDLEKAEHLRGLSGSVDDVVRYITQSIKNPHERAYIFIDEVQYIHDFSKTVKYLVDHYSDKFKLIMTGSSSLLIKQTFKESMVGRKDILELYPLSFKEFCLFKGEDRIFELLSEGRDSVIANLSVRYAELTRLLQEFMIFGGYPEVVLTENKEDKVNLLNDIIGSYILKDVKYLFKIDNIDQFNHLVRYLAVSIGKELNIKGISREVGLYWETVQKHILALQESYILSKIRPYHSNLTTELRQMPKVYFTDLGVRNTLINNFNELDLRPDRGEIFENYVYNQLYLGKSLLAEIKYWKTRNGQEVDFVVLDEGKITAYEVKYGREANNFLTFMNAYPDAVCLTVRFNYQKKAGEIPGWAV